MTPPERSPERDAAIELMLPLAATQGWRIGTLRQAAGPDADLLFPGGAADLVQTYIDLMDRRMVQHAAPLLANQRLTQRVRTLIATRLALAHPHRAAARRAVAALATPGRARLSASCTARTVDAIWHAAGDTAADFSWYTKRATLAAVYTSTLLFWLNETTTEEAALAFLDRRLADVGRIAKLRGRLTNVMKRPVAV